MHLRNLRALRCLLFTLSISAFSFPTVSFSQAIYIPKRWQVQTYNPAKETIAIYHGETVALEPQYVTYDGAYVSLSNCYEVRLEYRSSDMDAGVYYYATGEVANASLGQARILFGPDQDTGASSYSYRIRLSGADSASLKAQGTIKLLGDVDFVITNTPPAVTSRFDWASVEHVNLSSSPFADEGDLLAINQKNDAQDIAIANVEELVGSGVAGVESNLAAHIAAQAITDADQDVQIAQALLSANMGGDISGVSTDATVVATQGRTLPTAGDTPQDKEAIVWDAALGRYTHGSVDLSAIEADIALLEANKASRSEYAAWTNEITGMIDGNDHSLLYIESFVTTNWLETSPDQWEHVVNATWTLTDGSIAYGQGELYADTGVLILDYSSMSQCVSRVETDPDNDWMIQVGPDDDGPWSLYDDTRDNVPATNMFAIRLSNTSGSAVTLDDVTVYTWTYPERVGATRDFAGLHLLVDTPDGTIGREAVNVEYVEDTEPGGDTSGTLATGLTVERIQGTAVNPSGLETGEGYIYYESLDEFRPADLATQAEQDSALALKTDTSTTTALTARVTSLEGGNVPISGDVVGSNLQSTVVQQIQGTPVDAPAQDQYSPMYDLASGRIVWRSILSSNLVYATGTNDVADMPAQAAGLYRAMYASNAIMPLVVDQQILGWLGQDGLTIPYGTLNLLQSNLTANVHLYDGGATEPSLATVSDPDTGWFRPSADTWRFMAGGNVIVDLDIAGLTMGAGRSVVGYATTGTVATLAAEKLSKSGGTTTGPITFGDDYLHPEPIRWLHPNQSEGHYLLGPSIDGSHSGLWLAEGTGPGGASTNWYRLLMEGQDLEDDLWIDGGIGWPGAGSTPTDYVGWHYAGVAPPNTHRWAGIFVRGDGLLATVLRIGEAGEWSTQTVWQAANDGAGTGLDADLLDGKHASEFADTWTAMSVTNSWLDQSGVTNTQIYINGLLQSWATNGVSM